jgi:hypothetical protein
MSQFITTGYEQISIGRSSLSEMGNRLNVDNTRKVSVMVDFNAMLSKLRISGQNNVEDADRLSREVALSLPHLDTDSDPFYISTKKFIDTIFDQNPERNVAEFGSPTSDIDSDRVGYLIQNPSGYLYRKFFSVSQASDLLNELVHSGYTDETSGYLQIPEGSSVVTIQRFYDTDTSECDYYESEVSFVQKDGVLLNMTAFTDDCYGTGTNALDPVYDILSAYNEDGPDEQKLIYVARWKPSLVLPEYKLDTRSFPYLKVGEPVMVQGRNGPSMKQPLLEVYFNDKDEVVRTEPLFGVDLYVEDMAENPLGWHTGENLPDYDLVVEVPIDDLEDSDGAYDASATDVYTSLGEGVVQVVVKRWLEKYIKPDAQSLTRRTPENIPRPILQALTDTYDFGFVSSTRSAYRMTSPGRYVVQEDLVAGHHVQGDDVQKTINHGTIVGPPPFHLGPWTLISVESDNVHINLNGHCVSMAEGLILYQRFYAMIETNIRPFPNGEGGFDTDPRRGGRDLPELKNLRIHGGRFGRTSHHAIHGTRNRFVAIEDVQFETYEVSAITLNSCQDVVVRNCNIGKIDENIRVSRYWGAWRDPMLALRRIQRLYGKHDNVLELKDEMQGGPITKEDLAVCYAYLNAVAIVSDARRHVSKVDPVVVGETQVKMYSDAVQF